MPKFIFEVSQPTAEAIQEVIDQFEDPETGLKRIVEKLDANTESVITIPQFAE